MRLVSQILIAQDIEQTIKALEALKVDENIIPIVNAKQFLVDDVKLAIEKAYLTSRNRDIIILASPIFSEVVQNRLLKILEEPPPNKEFILITPSKSSLLPTIKSRLVLHTLDDKIEEEPFELDMAKLNLSMTYEFIQAHQRTSASNAKVLVERLLKEAIASKFYKIDEELLDLFTKAYQALDMGSPVAFVLSTVMLKLLAKKRRKGV
ncbi:MAG: DNA polymerase III subunit delta' [Campylobacterota bacterium]|nr:DNA polymerase III subunit delta' [Campylobacterota bacterium]